MHICLSPVLESFCIAQTKFLKQACSHPSYPIHQLLLHRTCESPQDQPSMDLRYVTLGIYTAVGNLRGLVRQLSIDQFENEGRRVSMGTSSVEKPQRTPLFERHNSDPGVHKVTVQTLNARL